MKRFKEDGSIPWHNFIVTQYLITFFLSWQGKGEMEGKLHS